MHCRGGLESCLGDPRPLGVCLLIHELLSLLDSHFCEASLQADGIERGKRNDYGKSVHESHEAVRETQANISVVPSDPCCIPGVDWQPLKLYQRNARGKLSLVVLPVFGISSPSSTPYKTMIATRRQKHDANKRTSKCRRRTSFHLGVPPPESHQALYIATK